MIILMAGARVTGSGRPPPKPTLGHILKTLKAFEIEAPTDAAGIEALRQKLAPFKILPDLITGLGLGSAMSQQFLSFLQTPDTIPSPQLLTALRKKAATIKKILTAPALSSTFMALVSQSGLAGRTPPKEGIGVVILDADRTVIEGESTLHLMVHGLLMDPLRLLGLPHAPTRLWKTLRMFAQYEKGTLSPEGAQDAVASLLDGVPVLPATKTWVDSGGRGVLKRAVLRDARREAREIVRQEWEAKIAAGEMAGPIDEDLLHEESLSRIYVVSSQATQVLRGLTAAGPDREDLLGGIPPENIIGSDAEYDEEGRIRRGTFSYCFGVGKFKTLTELFKKRGLVLNPQTTRVYTDHPHYDGPLLEFASLPEHRVIIDPSRQDMQYARTWGTRIIFDHWSEYSMGRFVEEGGGGQSPADEPHFVPKTLFMEEDHGIFPDTTRPTVTDAATRAVFGALEMAPVILAELGHNYADDAGLQSVGHAVGHAGAAFMAAGIGALYGPLNRGVVGHLAVGALCAGAVAFCHGTGHLAQAMLTGAASLLGLHYLWNRAIFMPGAREIPPAYARGGRQTWNYALRLGLTTLWSAGLHFGMRVFGLG